MFVWKKQTLKEKGKKNKKSKNQHINVFQKGVDGQKNKEKWSCERDDKRKTRKKKKKTKTELDEKKDFKDRPLGDQKKTLKLQENNLFGFFPNKENKTHKEK